MLLLNFFKSKKETKNERRRFKKLLKNNSADEEEFSDTECKKEQNNSIRKLDPAIQLLYEKDKNIQETESIHDPGIKEYDVPSPVMLGLGIKEDSTPSNIQLSYENNKKEEETEDTKIPDSDNNNNLSTDAMGKTEHITLPDGKRAIRTKGSKGRKRRSSVSSPSVDYFKINTWLPFLDDECHEPHERIRLWITFVSLNCWTYVNPDEDFGTWKLCMEIIVFGLGFISLGASIYSLRILMQIEWGGKGHTKSKHKAKRIRKKKKIWKLDVAGITLYIVGFIMVLFAYDKKTYRFVDTYRNTPVQEIVDQTI